VGPQDSRTSAATNSTPPRTPQPAWRAGTTQTDVQASRKGPPNQLGQAKLSCWSKGEHKASKNPGNAGNTTPAGAVRQARINRQGEWHQAFHLVGAKLKANWRARRRSRPGEPGDLRASATQHNNSSRASRLRPPCSHPGDQQQAALGRQDRQAARPPGPGARLARSCWPELSKAASPWPWLARPAQPWHPGQPDGQMPPGKY